MQIASQSGIQAVSKKILKDPKTILKHRSYIYLIINRSFLFFISFKYQRSIIDY